MLSESCGEAAAKLTSPECLTSLDPSVIATWPQVLREGMVGGLPCNRGSRFEVSRVTRRRSIFQAYVFLCLRFRAFRQASMSSNEVQRGSCRATAPLPRRRGSRPCRLGFIKVLKVKIERGRWASKLLFQISRSRSPLPFYQGGVPAS